MKLQNFKVPESDGLPSDFSQGIAYTTDKNFKQFLYVDGFIGEDKKDLDVQAYVVIDLPLQLDIEAYIKAKKLEARKIKPDLTWPDLNKDGVLLT